MGFIVKGLKGLFSLGRGKGSGFASLIPNLIPNRAASNPLGGQIGGLNAQPGNFSLDPSSLLRMNPQDALKALLALQASFGQQAASSMIPFGKSLIDIGTQAAGGKAPDVFLRANREALNPLFQQARQNLFNTLSSSGQGFSGIGAGPIANLESQQAQALAAANLDAILKGLGLGSTGAGILSNFNLTGASSASQDLFNNQRPSVFGSLLGGLAGNVLGSVGKGLGGKITDILFPKGKGGGCWIFTALFGKDTWKTKMCWAWLTNPEYGWASRSMIGQTVAKLYYLFGKQIAEVIKRNKTVEQFCRFFADWLWEHKVAPCFGSKFQKLIRSGGA